MKKKAYWKKIIRYQQTDAWCGPAVIQMTLAAAGMRIAQKDIAKDVCHKWWGTTQQSIYAYLSRYFKKLNFKEHASWAHVSYHLRAGHVVIVNWFDNIEDDHYTASNEYDYGHYSIIADYDSAKKTVTLADPSEGRGLWNISRKEFNKRWYDYLDVHGQKWVDGWLLWVDPKSKIKN